MIHDKIITRIDSCNSTLQEIKEGERLAYTNQTWQILKSDDPLSERTLTKTMDAFSLLVARVDSGLQEGQIVSQKDLTASYELVTRMKDWSQGAFGRFEKKNSSWWRRFLAWLPFSPLAKYQQEVAEKEVRLQSLLQSTAKHLEQLNASAIDKLHVRFASYPNKFVKVIDELIHTESSYGLALQALIKVGEKLRNNRDALLEGVSPKSKKACGKAMKAMQPLLEDLVRLKQLSDDLLKKFLTASNPEDIARAFQENKELLAYFGKAPLIMEKYKQIAAKGGEEFQKKIKELLIQESDHSLVESILIMPVQRLPRYQLLLNECIKAIPDRQQVKASFEEALEIVINTAKKVNKAV